MEYGSTKYFMQKSYFSVKYRAENNGQNLGNGKTH